MAFYFFTLTHWLPWFISSSSIFFTIFLNVVKAVNIKFSSSSSFFTPQIFFFFFSTTSTTSIISDCNWTQTHNHLVHKQTLNHLANYRVWIHSEKSTWDDKNIQSTSIILILFLCITTGTNFMQVLKSKWQDLTLISTYDLSSEFL